MARMEERFREARSAWPGVDLAWDRFAARLPEDTDGLHVSDLYLAVACAEGNTAAVEALEQRILSQIPSLIARVDASLGSEVAQLVRMKLLVGSDGKPGAIADYAGRGALKSWVQVVATRLALNLKRAQQRHTELGDDEADRILATPDPELAFIKHRAREDFRLAFQAALAGLEPASRHLLRLHYLDRLTLQQIGALEQVDKSTISRRMEAVRQQLLEETRRLLRERLALESGEFESLMGLIVSSLDVSIEAFFRAR